MYTGCHCPVTAGQKGGGVWEMDIRDPPWAQANFLPPVNEQPVQIYEVLLSHLSSMVTAKPQKNHHMTIVGQSNLFGFQSPHACRVIMHEYCAICALLTLGVRRAQAPMAIVCRKMPLQAATCRSTRF